MIHRASAFRPTALALAACGLFPALARAAPAQAAPGPRASPPPGVVRVEVEDAEQSCALAVEAPAERVTEERLRALVRLRDAWVGSWSHAIADVEASPWMDSPGKVERALPRMEDVLARFDAEVARLGAPADLDAVVRWNREDLAFRVWLVRAELDFCKGDARALGRTFADLDAGRLCAAAAAEVLALPASQRCREAAYAWGNCANRAFRHRHGAFPRAAWDAHLRATGVVVRTLRCDEP